MIDSYTMIRALLFILLFTGLIACQPAAVDAGNIRELTVLYTNDEHGWMEGVDPGSAAGNLMGLWRNQEGFSEDGPFLVLSGGDHWTGPAISAWFKGESMVEIMNAFPYDASAIGNHEFDFGLDNLRQRIDQARFPFLAANIRWTATQQLAEELGIRAFAVLNSNDLRIGLIGLTTTSTPLSTNPINVVDLTFSDYESTLRAAVASLRVNSVDLIFVISHVCMAELRSLALAVQDLGIALMGGGHCNEAIAEQIGDTVLLESSGYLRNYARAKFRFDTRQNKLVDVSFAVVNNQQGRADAQIEALVAYWRQRTEAELDTVLAWSAARLPANDDNVQALVVSSWLLSDPTADIAINNRLGVREGLPQGVVTLAHVIGMMPFENTLVAVQLSGEAILQVLSEGQRPAVAGMRQTGTGWQMEKSGQALNPQGMYRVLVNSFMYNGGAGYAAIARFDTRGFDTAIDYRQPIVEWLQRSGSSAERPLVLPY